MIPIEGKTVLITGASSGIGRAAAAQLKDMGANVVLIGRNPERTKAAAEELGAPYFLADFAKLDEVRRLAAQLREACPKIDVLLNNAGGIFGKQREITVDGFERTFQVCYLSAFLLTGLLFDRLIESKATVVNTSSVAAQIMSRLDVDDLNLAKRYDPYRAYGNAKLEMTLFAKEFQRRYGRTGVSMASFHPGVVTTNFTSESDGPLRALYKTALRADGLRRLAGMLTPEEGADTAVWLASTQPGVDWQPGNYFVKRRIAKTHRLAYDPAVARSLWTQSEKLVAFSYPKL